MAAPLLLLALLLAAGAGAGASDKRNENELLSPMPFVLGSRYGRSPQRLITPRNDRFFMGSRYGKRSGLNIGGARSALGFTIDTGETNPETVARLETGGEKLPSVRQLQTDLGTLTGDVGQGEARPSLVSRPAARMGLGPGPGLGLGLGLGMGLGPGPGLEATLPLQCAPTAAPSLYRCVPAHFTPRYRQYGRAEEWWSGRPRLAAA